MGIRALGTRRSDLDLRLEHGGDGGDRAASVALDRGLRIMHYCNS